MNYRQQWITTLMISAMIFSVLPIIAQTSNQKHSPFLGWNSYDCYGSNADANILNENLDVFIEKLKPYGYEYFVIDAGWYRDYDLKPGENWPSKGDKAHLNIDEYGRFIPSEKLFPNGFKDIIDRAHKQGIKFGIHLMRGIPREAVMQNLPIKGTKYFARDIADTNDTCNWSSLNYGVDMDKPGAQAYYNSILELVAGWGVDFIKYDDIVHKPREINAVANAIEKCGREIVLSISPGDDINPDYFETYKRADMIRITRDIWDLSEDIQISFERWKKMQPFSGKGFWLDMDMIPFGHIKISNPRSNDRAFSARGYDRLDNFSFAQKKTFITQRALAASPLFMGGALTSSPNIVFELLTNEDMLKCDQNGITGKLESRIHNYSTNIYIWRTPYQNLDNEGWIGIFNQNEYLDIAKLNKEQLGLMKNASYELYDIWNHQYIEDGENLNFEIPGEDVVFIHYKKK